MRAYLTGAVLCFASVAWAQATDINIEKFHTAPSSPGVPAEIRGFIRSTYFYSDPALQDEIIGSRNGFRLFNARVGIRAVPTDKIAVEISADGASSLRNPTDPLEGRRNVDLRDAFIAMRLHPLAHLRAGQFKAPFDVETLLGDGDLPFVTRSVITDGINPPDAFSRTGLSLDRQLGVELSSEPLKAGDFSLAYAVALMNGNGQNALLNDNGAVMPVARLALNYKDAIRLGFNGYYNPSDIGVRPNRLNVNHLAAGADVVLKWNQLKAIGVLLWRRTTTTNATLPREIALGYMGQLHYLHDASGWEAAVRYTHFDPSSVDPTDRTWDVATMVGYRMKSLPMRFALQYDIREEQDAVKISNNSLEGMVQISW